MERTTIHIAVLVVAEDPASVDLANATFMSDKATGAGHRIVAQEIVENDEAAIRDQLSRWIAQPHIDVIVSAGADDEAAAALGPLVTKPLPGLTDQLRLLARDRGSVSRPVAARCSAKFVFLLPPEVAALGAALNQLVLPQLDSTAERNLVKEMPRHGGEAVPQVISAEKTVTGAGVAPKIPAEPRGKRKTGANIVARNEARQAAMVAQDATRQIDRAKLEQQLARSASSHDAPTRPHIDLATMLPGSSDRADTEEELPLEPPTLDDPTDENPIAPAVRTVQPARLRGSAPIGTAKAPAASAPVAAKPAAIPSIAPKPAASAPAAKPAAIPSIAPKPAPAPIAAKPASSEGPATAKELPKPTPVSGLTTATPPSGVRAPTKKPAVEVDEAPTVPRGANGTGAAARSPANGAGRPAQGSPAPIGEVRRAELEAAAVEDAIDAASSADILEAASADFEELSTPPSPSRVQAAPMIPARPATGPAPVVPQRPTTGPAPVVPQRPATGPAPLVGAPSLPPPVAFQGPELLDLREGTQKKRRSRTGTALVRENKRSSILMYIMLAGAAVAGFFAVVHFFPQSSDGGAAAGGSAVAMTTTDPPSPPPTPGSSAPAGSAVAGSTGSDTHDVAVAPGSGDSPPAHDATPPVTTPPVTTPPVTTPPTHATAHDPGTHHTTTAPAGTPVTHPDTAKTDTAKTDTPKADTPKTDTPAKADPPKTDTTAKAEPPADSDGCDEVSCVMEHYERACCARFKPADSGFHPKGTVPDQLDKSMVKAGIEKVKPNVIACGEKITAKGTVKLSITVGPEGNVKDISIADAPDAGLGDCVLAAVKKAQFGKAVNATTFTYPFVF